MMQIEMEGWIREADEVERRKRRWAKMGKPFNMLEFRIGTAQAIVEGTIEMRETADGQRWYRLIV